MSDHVATRPTWRCSCGVPWPCPTRQRQLLAECEGRRSEVGAFLARIYPQMRQDLTNLSPATVYGQLFGWLRRGLRPAGWPGVGFADVPGDERSHDR